MPADRIVQDARVLILRYSRTNLLLTTTLLLTTRRGQLTRRHC